MSLAQELFENASFNGYQGPAEPELLIVSSGCAWNYAMESVDILSLWDRAGVLKFGTTWPLPANFLKKHLSTSKRILFVEEVDSFLEDNVTAFYAQRVTEMGVKEFLGKHSGHLPDCGEQTPAIVLDALREIFNLPSENSAYREKLQSSMKDMIIPPREFGFCAGCPHRGSYYAVKTALAWDGRDGFVSGDIGCYTMAVGPTGFSQVKSVHAMGSGLGLASGYGKLEPFGFDQPVISVCGDSTFFHASIPALINAKFNESDILLLVLDNSATAMTGFQPHPGTGVTAMGMENDPVDIAELCRSLNIAVEVADPYKMSSAAATIYRMMQLKGPRVVVLNRRCALEQGREGGFPYEMEVNRELCLGDACGCNRYCTRIFRCPGLIWDNEESKAKIDDVICVACGICADVCPQGAISKNEKS